MAIGAPAHSPTTYDNMRRSQDMVEIWMYAQLIEAPFTESHSATPVHEVTILAVAVLCTEKKMLRISQQTAEHGRLTWQKASNIRLAYAIILRSSGQGGRPGVLSAADFQMNCALRLMKTSRNAFESLDK